MVLEPEVIYCDYIIISFEKESDILECATLAFRYVYE